MTSTNEQNGSFLIEFILVMALVLLVAVWGSGELAERAKNLQAQSLANWMRVAQNGLQNYLARDYENITKIINAHGVDEYNLSFKPAWIDLLQGGFINQSWSINGPARQQLDYKINLVGDCALKNCRLQALIYTSKALTDKTGKSDLAFIANWLLAANGQGLVYRENNGQGAFMGSGLSLAMPIGNFTEGMVALLVKKDIFESISEDNSPGSEIDTGGNPGSGSDPGAQLDIEKFVLIQDDRDPDLQGDLSAQGKISSQSFIQAKEGIILNSTSNINQACQRENEITINSNFPGLLICKGGIRQLSSYPFAGGYMVNSKKGCVNTTGQSTANPVTGACNCPPTYIRVQISESGTLTDQNGLNMGYVCMLR